MRCAIVDDDITFSNKLNYMIKKYFQSTLPNSHVEIISRHFEQLLKLEFDIIFLDIDLNEYNGIKLSQQINKIFPNTLIVFVSSLNELVFDALTTHPLFFMRKNFLEKDFVSLKIILDKVLKKHFSHFFINDKSEDICIYNHEIHYMTIAGHDLTINLGNTSYTLRISLSDILKKIDDHDIIQVSKDVAVNLNHVVKISKNTIYLSQQVKIEIGRAYKDKVQTIYKEFLLK
ncbi:MAG: LytTR family transcriptional regulator DNA-binding domain-containing protein [Coprobacillus cateniformis]|uniref:LytR/AlgR family response regulator transcription factor n=1 Tax=Longibaculum muris TaxID=1796628 RepID=UPI003AB2AEC0|nr:LytTR family transcriptional regulator DNA-binding domain-containing protein [Coprobacillus cateniformis]